MICNKYGIDFGTTNSSIALHFKGDDDEQHTYVVELRRDKRPRVSLPSVFFLGKNQIYAGEEAKKELDKIPGNKIPKNQYKKRVKTDLEKMGQNLGYDVGGRWVQGVDILAALLRQLKEKADIAVREQELKMDGVVMGVPVAFDQIAKGVLQEALYKAGFYKSLEESKAKTEFVSEPLAVAIHYGLDLKKDATIMVFDFGGGTLDLALVNLKKNVQGDVLHPHETLGTAGRPIGGEELNKLFFINSFCKPNKYGKENLCRAFRLPINLSPTQLWEELLDIPTGIRFIEDVVERCKIELSDRSQYKCPAFTYKNVFLPEKTFYKDDFVSSIEDVFDEIEHVVDECLAVAGIDDPYKVDSVIMAGGSSLIPAVQDILSDKFGTLHVNVKPDEVDDYVVENVAANKILDSEVLTSVVRGLARVGYKERPDRPNLKNPIGGEIIIRQAECDFGVWDGVRNCFLPIIERGTLIKDTKFNKLSQQGKFRLVECRDLDVSSVEVEIYQKKYEGQEKYHKLGTINIPHPGGMKYKIYMTIDEDTGMLEVVIYDARRHSWIEDIPLNERRYDI